MRVLTAVTSRPARVRARATAAAATGMGVALLIAASTATIRDTVPVGTSTWVDEQGREVSREMFEAAGGLSPFLAQPGLRPGVVTAAVLLLLPFLALAVQALRVGQVVQERRSQQLLVAGATWADLRRLRVAATSAAFVRGGLLAGPVYLLLWLVLGPALPAGSRLLPPLHPAMVPAWALVVVVLWVLARVLAVWGSRREDALLWRSSGLPAQVPSRAFVVGTALAAVALVFAVPAVGAGTAVFAALLVTALVLALLAAGAGAARSAAGSVRRPVPAADADTTAADGASGTSRRVPAAGRRRGRRAARWRPGSGDGAVSLLADAQRRGSTTAVTGTAGVLFVCGLSFGVEAALSAQILNDRASEGSGYGSTDVAFYVGGAALAGAVGLVAALVAVAALVLSLTDHLLGNRRAVASTAALGTETRRLVRVQALSLIRTAVPATTLGVLVSALPYSLAFSGDLQDGWSWPTVLPLAVAVVVAVVMTVVCSLLAAALTGRVRAAAALENLRVP
ncbi:hypothetical protein GCM10009528_33780 [Kineococcus aurantiacus]